MSSPGFANILLSGPCNRRCPDCIGAGLGHAPHRNTLGLFPLPGLERFTGLLTQHGINQISLTGLDTEPMLYRHQESLLKYLRGKVPRAQVSLHTNGSLVLDKIDLFNQYDRATISLPSFSPETCREMTGSAEVLDMEAIAKASRIPIKISTLLTRHNAGEIPEIIERCRALGFRRLVLRKLYGGDSPEPSAHKWKFVRMFGENPVYDAGGMEITVWDFTRTRLHCLNLFPDGRVADSYLLDAQNPEREAARALGGVSFSSLPQNIQSARSIGVFLGSFDPPHRGHVYLAEELLNHFEKCLLLVPTRHFHKTIVSPYNADLTQRLSMLDEIRRMAPDRIGVGLAGEVLFVRLDQKLQSVFPNARVWFGMGDETWRRVLDSPSYYRKSGLDWTSEDAERLHALRSRVLLFNRSDRCPDGITVPPTIRGISSSRVRAAVAALGGERLNIEAWARDIQPMVPGNVAGQIRESGIYPGA